MERSRTKEFAPRSDHPPIVLIVDDDKHGRHLLGTYLSNRGYRTLEAKSGEEALQMIQTGTLPDIVLLDIMMPGMGGLQVLEAIRIDFQPAELPVILLTALGDTGHVVAGLELGANDYISKPYQLAELGARLRGHLMTKLLLEANRVDLTRLQELDEIKDKFLQITAHDLKSPLGTIIMGLQIMSDSSPELEAVMPEIGRILYMMDFATKSMRSIIEDYLDLQVLKTGRLTLHVERIILNEQIREVVEHLRPYAESKGITVEVHLETNLPACPADPDRLAQVITNLLNNAIKFSPTGSVVVARTHANGGNVRFEVQDNGPGIPPEDVPLLFQEFTRLRNRPTGGEKSSGVGLAISRYLVEAHAGQIGVESTPGKGTVFWVELPTG